MSFAEEKLRKSCRNILKKLSNTNSDSKLFEEGFVRGAKDCFECDFPKRNPSPPRKFLEDDSYGSSHAPLLLGMINPIFYLFGSRSNDQNYYLKKSYKDGYDCGYAYGLGRFRANYDILEKLIQDYNIVEKSEGKKNELVIRRSE